MTLECEANKPKPPRFPIYLPKDQLDALVETVNALIICGKGILSADENPSTLGVRFKTIGMENSKANRRAYREVLFSADCSLRKYVSGIIIHPDTLEECTAEKKPLIEMIHVSPSIAISTI